MNRRLCHGFYGYTLILERRLTTCNLLSFTIKVVLKGFHAYGVILDTKMNFKKMNSSKDKSTTNVFSGSKRNDQLQQELNTHSRTSAGNVLVTRSDIYSEMEGKSL